MNPKPPGSGWLIAASVVQMMMASGFVIMPAFLLLTGGVSGLLTLLCLLFLVVGLGVGAAAWFIQKGRRWAWSASLAIAVTWLGLWAFPDIVLLVIGNSIAETISGILSHVPYYAMGGVLLWTLLAGRSAVAGNQ